MDAETKAALKALLKDAIISKIDNYEPETEYKPFFDAIFSKEHVAIHSVIQSFYTSFGMSIYEQVAELLAKSAGYEAQRQYKLLGAIDRSTESLISKIHAQLRDGKEPEKAGETEAIRKSIKIGKPAKDPDSTVDLFVRKPDGEEFYFDITTVKPNKKEFVELKRKMLRWVALRLSADKKIKINTAVVIPYNPYHPKPYERWTKESMFSKDELLVGKDFWNLVAGEDVYNDLIGVFKEVGKELRKKIDQLPGG